MKRSLFLILILFSFSRNLLFAQVGLRVEGGPNLSNINSTLYDNSDFKPSFKTGFQFSTVAILRPESKLQFYLGVGIGNQGTVSELLRDDLRFANGSTISSMIGFEDIEQIYSKNIFYLLEAPIGMNYYFNQSTNGLFLDIGFSPTYSLQIVSRSITEFKDGRRRKEEFPTVVENTNRFNVNVRLGIGYQLNKLRISLFGESETRNRGNYLFKSYFYRTGLSIGYKLLEK